MCSLNCLQDRHKSYQTKGERKSCDCEDVCVYIHTRCNVLQHDLDKASQQRSKKVSEKQPRRRSLPFLRQHQGFQYHQEVPEGHLLLEVLRGLWDQGDRADPNTEEEIQSGE